MCDLISEDISNQQPFSYLHDGSIGKSLKQMFITMQNKKASSISNFIILQERMHANQVFLQFQLQLFPLQKNNKTYHPLVVHFDLGLQLMENLKTINLHARLYEIQLYNQKLPAINSRHRMEICHLIKKFNSSVDTSVRVFADQTGKLAFVNILCLKNQKSNAENVTKDIVKGIGQIIQCISDFVKIAQFFNFLKNEDKNNSQQKVNLSELRLMLMESNQIRRQILNKGAQSSIKESLSILFPKLNLLYKQYSDEILEQYSIFNQQSVCLLSQQRKMAKKDVRYRLANGILFLQNYPGQNLNSSNEYCQEMIEGGQSLIKKVRKKGWIVNTILQVRQPHKSQGSLSKRGVQILNQDKIQTQQEFAVKFIKDKNIKSQVESFINQYNFLRQNANEACQQLAKFYLDISQSKNEVDLPQRSIYMDWQEGDLLNMVYQPILTHKKMFSTEYLVKLCSELASALCFLNYTRTCHRDLKMKNILIGKDSSLKLCDFGSCYPIYGQSLDRTKNFSPKMRTTFALTYNSSQLPHQVKGMYSKEEYNSHQTFDMYCYGLIIKNLKNSFLIEDEQIKNNLQFICSISLSPDPLYRLLPIQVLIFLNKIKETYNF